MTDSDIAAAFFDLGDTLGTAVVGGTPPRLIAFDVFPYSIRVLANLKAKGLKLGVISNTGAYKGPVVDSVLSPTGLLDCFDRDEPPLDDGTPVTKSIPEIFRRAAKRARLDATPARNLFVGEDSNERLVAMSTGWKVCPHPCLVGEIVAGRSLRFVKITVPSAHAKAPWREELQKRAFLPMQMFGPGGDSPPFSKRLLGLPERG